MASDEDVSVAAESTPQASHDAPADDQPAHPEEQPGDPAMASWEAFDHAIREKDLDLLRGLVESGQHDINTAPDEERVTPLFTLVREGIWWWPIDELEPCIRLMVAHGANVNHHNCVGTTPLHVCAEFTKEDGSVPLAAARILLELGADPNVGRHRNDDGAGSCSCGGHIGAVLDAVTTAATGQAAASRERAFREDHTPLHSACMVGNLDMARLLIEHGASRNAYDETDGLPLHLAIGKEPCNIEVCKLLLEGEGLQLDARESNELTPLHQAVLSAVPEMVSMLLERGADLEQAVEGEKARSSDEGCTPLILACSRTGRSESRLEVAKLLVGAGANINAVGGRDQTALTLAVMNDHVDVVKFLISHGADMAALEKSDAPPLTIAATKGHAAICRWLVQEQGCDVNARSNDGEEYTPLIQAAGYGNAETVAALIDLGAEKEAAIYDGRRASHFAAFKGKDGCMRELIARGVDIEATDDADWTPLHFAARYHHPDVLRLLLSHGAAVGKKVTGGPEYKTQDGTSFQVAGFTAVDLAKTKKGGDECVGILEDAGEVLSEEVKELTDDDLLEEKATCIIM